jgi:uncharacterized coiled-coil protein SlyX
MALTHAEAFQLFNVWIADARRSEQRVGELEAKVASDQSTIRDLQDEVKCYVVQIGTLAADKLERDKRLLAKDEQIQQLEATVAELRTMIERMQRVDARLTVSLTERVEAVNKQPSPPTSG